MEESYNVLQSAEIMDCILGFTQYDVCEPEIRKTLDKISFAYGKKREGIGYETVVPTFRELYENPQFKYVVKKHRMAGTIREIKIDFENKVGVGTYDEFSSELDKLLLSANYYEKMSCENKVKEYNKKYNS